MKVITRCSPREGGIIGRGSSLITHNKKDDGTVIPAKNPKHAMNIEIIQTSGFFSENGQITPIVLSLQLNGALQIPEKIGIKCHTQ